VTAPSTRPSLYVLVEGSIVRDGDRIVDASSSSVLVESAGRRIVVDTCARGFRSALVEALYALGLEGGEIDVVVNTHLHSDHSGGNDLFRGARFYAHRLESPATHFVKPVDGTVLAPGVSIVETPGHTLGSISVLVEGERRYAVAGDALPTKGNYESHVPPGVNVDPRLALASMDRLLSWADVVVPGHGAPFDVLGKK
jgi:N-acyl homoserine lactone hydrolase